MKRGTALTFGAIVAGMIILAFGVTKTSAATGINQQIYYQGRLTNTSSTEVADNAYDMTFSIYNVASAGSASWTEDWSTAFVGQVDSGAAKAGTSITYKNGSGTPAVGQVLTDRTVQDRVIITGVAGSTITISPTATAWSSNDNITTKPCTINGVFAVRLGSLTALSLDFTSDTYYLGVKISTDSEMKPRKRITGQPYAINTNNLVGNGKIDITNTATPQLKITNNGSNYLSVGVASNGVVTLDSNGAGAGFTFQDSTTISGTLQGTTVTDGTISITAGNITSGTSATFSGLITAGQGNLTGTAANQMKVGYDTNNYYTANVSSAGAVTFDATGASAGFAFQDAVTFSSGFTVPGGTSPIYVGNYTPAGAPTANDVYVSGRYAYLADGASGLQAIDIDVPATPVYIGTYDTSGNAYGVAIDGRYAYVADGTSGLQVINIANNYAMTLVGTYDTSGTAYGVYVSGKYAYVADGASGIQIIDISNPAAPTRTGTYVTTDTAYYAYVSGKYAYVANATAGLTIVDVSAPAAPTYVGNYTPTSSPTATSVYVSGRYAYLADGASGVQIIDVSNPASPSKTGTYDTTGTAYDVYVSGKYAYVADRDSGIVTINVSTPASPTYVGSYDTTGSAYGIQVAGRNAWVADGTAGLTSINIGGADLSTLDAGNVTTGNLNTTDSADIGQNLFVRGTLNTGTNGIQSDGVINASGGLSVTPSANPVYVGNYSATVNAVYVSGKYAYAATSASTQIIDIANPAAPTHAGFYGSPEAAQYVVVSGRYAYEADGNTGLQIIDISKTSAPTIAGAYNTSGFAWGVYVSGKYAYVADDSSGLQIIDVSNPNAPIRTGTYDTSGTADGVYVSGKYAYVADNTAGLTIVDISNPASPTYVGNYNTSGTAYGVYVSGRYAYVADEASGLQIIDVSNPASPTLTGTYDTTGTDYGVYVAGKYAYVADDTAGLTILNVSNPASPTYIGNYNTSGDAYGVQVVGKYAWVADGGSGLTAINIGGADLATLDAGNVTTGNLNVTESADIGQNLFVRGTLNVGIQGIQSDGPINASGGLAATPLAKPTYVGYANLPTSSGGFYISGRYAYVAVGVYGSGSLRIVDISNPSAPTLLGLYSTLGDPHDVYVSGKYAYVANGANGLSIVDVSNPNSPAYVGSYNTSGTAYNVYVSGKYAYVGDNSSGLQVIDISNPAAPTRVGTYDTSGTAYGVYVSGKYAYVADYDAGLQIIDVSNPASPTRVGTYNTSGYAYNVYVSGKYAYVGDYSSGLQIINISNPASPSRVGTYTTTQAYEVYVSGKYAYVADYSSGLRIIDVSNPVAPVQTGIYGTTNSATNVRVVGKYAWVLADSTLVAVNIGGADLSSVDAGNVTTGNLNVTDSADIGQNLFVRGTLNVGIQGILSDGPISAGNGNTTSLQAVSTTTPQMTLKYDNSNYVTWAVASNGLVTLDANGASAGFTFSDNVTLSGVGAGDSTNWGGGHSYAYWGQSGAGSVNTYVPYYGAAGSADSGFSCIRASSIVGIGVTVNTAPGADATYGARYEVYKNGSATGLYADLAGTNTKVATTQAIALSHCISNDQIQVRLESSGVANFASGTDIFVTIAFTN